MLQETQLVSVFCKERALTLSGRLLTSNRTRRIHSSEVQDLVCPIGKYLRSERRSHMALLYQWQRDHLQCQFCLSNNVINWWRTAAWPVQMSCNYTGELWDEQLWALSDGKDIWTLEIILVILFFFILSHNSLVNSIPSCHSNFSFPSISRKWQ